MLFWLPDSLCSLTCSPSRLKVFLSTMSSQVSSRKMSGFFCMYNIPTQWNQILWEVILHVNHAIKISRNTRKLKDEKISSEITTVKNNQIRFQKGCGPIVNNRLFLTFPAYF